ncbi:fumarylacetoacetate hydrolase family protein [Aestuariibacter salexigens]|uniref:fumarylacetoacetate hydrolase family protein n=1 Tax=Aestuariibacter salexigens TaxID=226010 RepID=UPI000411AA2D|nr:fumarylacetoacetate hydrolase family protein [Aestuariibacter salexigens]
MYCHHWIDGQATATPAGKVVCVGRNYLDHIKELGNDIPEQALLFIKPASALCDMRQPLCIPTDRGECHNELEVALLIGSELSGCALTDSQVSNAIVGVGLGLDLTLRDVQSSLKSKGQPWERAKAFDNSCPLSPFMPMTESIDLNDLHFLLTINKQVRQQGHTALMMRDALSLVKEIASIFTLLPGDVVLTGTPKGVGPLLPEDEVDAELTGYLKVQTQVKARVKARVQP